ncbi:MAG: hypothetical protein CM15mP65_18230 [Crocinitomicaceae bacterium]|nr:MAG: hypothetical protein CM15mP65_18230 [Crocinitomicaceae bacterium]
MGQTSKYFNESQKKHHFDVFINLSKFEGLPVSKLNQ